MESPTNEIRTDEKQTQNKPDEKSFDWRQLSSYKKNLYIMNHKPDCSFLVGNLECDAKLFHCHKEILRNTSPYFEIMFNGLWKESELSNEIYITDTDPVTFKKLLDFLYYNKLEEIQLMDISTVQNLIKLGEHFLVDDIKEKCIGRIKMNLEIMGNHEIITVFEYAYQLEDQELIKKCKEVITKRKFKQNNKPTEQKSTNGQNICGDCSRYCGECYCRQSAFGRSRTSVSPATKNSSTTISVVKDKIADADKDDITLCPTIYNLSPPVFYEFQSMLWGHIPEVERFLLIDTYVKINGFISEPTDSTEEISDKSEIKNNANNNNTKNKSETKNAYDEKPNSNLVPLTKEAVNMMLCSMHFLEMSAKEFCRGPGKSNLLDTEEKYNLLVGIINKH